MSIGGSVVECSPATWEARVRFPDNATFILQLSNTMGSHFDYHDNVVVSVMMPVL